jgi:hypothetical protein
MLSSLFDFMSRPNNNLGFFVKTNDLVESSKGIDEVFFLLFDFQ